MTRFTRKISGVPSSITIDTQADIKKRKFTDRKRQPSSKRDWNFLTDDIPLNANKPVKS